MSGREKAEHEEERAAEADREAAQVGPDVGRAPAGAGRDVDLFRDDLRDQSYSSKLRLVATKPELPVGHDNLNLRSYRSQEDNLLPSGAVGRARSPERYVS